MDPYQLYQQTSSQEQPNIPYDLLMKIPTDQMIKYIPCKVCGDRSSGVHYGIITCEGCKGFYRRATEENISTSCKNADHHGPITKENRNRCKECRLRACKIVGMNIETRVFGRMSRKGKENIIREVLLCSPGMLPNLISEARRIMANGLLERVSLVGRKRATQRWNQSGFPGPDRQEKRLSYRNFSRGRINENLQAPVEYMEMHPQTFQHHQPPQLLFHSHRQQQIPREMLPEAEAVALSAHNDEIPSIGDVF